MATKALPNMKNLSASKVVKCIIAQNGPMTTKAIAAFIPKYPELLKSNAHLKRHVLGRLKDRGELEKKINRTPSELPPNGLASSERNKKEVYVWRFPTEEDASVFKNVSLDDLIKQAQQPGLNVHQ
ncbi:hypothetical protein VTP01DRAFT_9218 [Rhizomucor pusillus]|uniref:uncharacterized protein n=1 Tax=Rhizomucor pusillus TaxID=4840 RepID=UPI0037441A76